MAPSEFVVERWKYAGRRFVADKLFGEWVDADGKTSFFKGRHRSVGASYDVEVLREGDSVRARIDSAVFVADRNANDETVRQWIMEDKAAYAADELRKLEASSKRDDDFGSLTLDEIREKMFDLTPMKRTAFLAQVLRRIGA